MKTYRQGATSRTWETTGTVTVLVIIGF